MEFSHNMFNVDYTETGLSMGLHRKALRPSVRQAAMFDFIEKKGRATVEELAAAYTTSVETVRRDLNVLAEAGRVRKVHGGAVRLKLTREHSFSDRLASNMRSKQEIAEKLVLLLRPGQSVMIDTGSTTLICSQAMARIRDLTVITNSTRIAECIAEADNGSRVVLLGGTYHADNAQTVGAQTCAEISRYRTDVTILTVSALDQTGAYDFSEDEAQVARAMIETANNLTVVADPSKFGRTSMLKICDLDRIDRLVLSGEPDIALTSRLAECDVALV